jgi:hypothetical protein
METTIADAADHWSLEDLALDRIEIGRVRPREELFLLLAGASLVEAGSDLYTRNLVRHFHDDAEVCWWLTNRWEPEELQHGRALRAYVNHVWPEFDWDGAFAAFFAEYSRGCTTERLEPRRGLEMAARCMVEMGTATYYRAIHALADEPVLARLAGFIERDEVRHYKHFLRYFNKYSELEHNGRASVLGALVRRLLEMRRNDTECGAWHAFNTRYLRASRNAGEFRRSVARSKALVRRHYPAPMAIKMFLKPLALPPVVNRLTYPAAWLAQSLIMR